MKLLIIGSDSFIAQNFVKYMGNMNVVGISRTVVHSTHEIIISDFFQIDFAYFQNVDVVMNFAAIVHRPDIMDDDVYYQVNYELAVHNAMKAKEARVKLFIQMSTIAVYDGELRVSVNTAYKPQGAYGNSKLNADNKLLTLQDLNFNVAIVRPPLVYGGRNAPGNMMRLIKLAKKGIPLPFKGVDNTRDFINVNNLVQYLKIIVEKQLNGIFLITDHEPVSTENLLRIFSKYKGRQPYIFKPPHFFLMILKKIRPREYDKLFGSLLVETNFPFEELVKRYSVEEGIFEMMKSLEIRTSD